jgi:hypothetical protein
MSEYDECFTNHENFLECFQKEGIFEKCEKEEEIFLDCLTKSVIRRYPDLKHHEKEVKKSYKDINQSKEHIYSYFMNKNCFKNGEITLFCTNNRAYKDDKTKICEKVLLEFVSCKSIKTYNGFQIHDEYLDCWNSLKEVETMKDFQNNFHHCLKYYKKLTAKKPNIKN